MDSRPSGYRNWLLLIAKLLMVMAVAWGIWHSVGKAMVEIDHHGFSIWQIQPTWLLLSGGFYLLGMLPMGLFWHRVLTVMQQRPRLRDSLRAYYIGHLGKYLPGKAMVVFLRAGLVQGPQVEKTAAAVSVFIETLTQMAVGAALAAAILAARFRDHWLLLLVALALMIVAGLPTLPPVLRRIVRVLKLTKVNPQIDKQLGSVQVDDVLLGWTGNTCGWFLLGLSLWATIRAIPGVEGKLPVGLDSQLLLTAAIALAVVAGFLSLIPGGFGVRELVLIPLLGDQLGLGITLALVSAVTVRLVWILSELLLSIILYVGVKKRVSV